jgi:hypothetical protein
MPLAVRDRARHAEPSPVVLAPTASNLLHVALDSHHIAVGGVVGGVVAVKRPWDGPPIVDVSLRELLQLVSWNGHVRTRRGRRYTVSVNVGPELTSSPSAPPEGHRSRISTSARDRRRGARSARQGTRAPRARPRAPRPRRTPLLGAHETVGRRSLTLGRRSLTPRTTR